MINEHVDHRPAPKQTVGMAQPGVQTAGAGPDSREQQAALRVMLGEPVGLTACLPACPPVERWGERARALLRMLAAGVGGALMALLAIWV